MLCGVPACVQGHPERCAGGVTSDPTERFDELAQIYGRDTLVGGYAWAAYRRLSHLCESFVDVCSVFFVLLMVDGHSSSSRGI